MDITLLNKEQKHIVILAGGVGDRFQNLMPKQFNILAGKPVLLHTLITYHMSSLGFKITLVLNEAHLPIWEKICEDYNVKIPFRIVFGGLSSLCLLLRCLKIPVFRIHLVNRMV